MDMVLKAAEMLIGFSVIALLLRNYQGTTQLISGGLGQYATAAHGLQSF